MVPPEVVMWSPSPIPASVPPVVRFEPGIQGRTVQLEDSPADIDRTGKIDCAREDQRAAANRREPSVLPPSEMVAAQGERAAGGDIAVRSATV